MRLEIPEEQAIEPCLIQIPACLHAFDHYTPKPKRKKSGHPKQFLPKETVIDAYTSDGTVSGIAKRLGIDVSVCSKIRRDLSYTEITEDLKPGKKLGVNMGRPVGT